MGAREEMEKMIEERQRAASASTEGWIARAKELRDRALPEASDDAVAQIAKMMADEYNIFFIDQRLMQIAAAVEAGLKPSKS